MIAKDFFKADERHQAFVWEALQTNLKRGKDKENHTQRHHGKTDEKKSGR